MEKHEECSGETIFPLDAPKEAKDSSTETEKSTFQTSAVTVAVVIL
jgi:hypothetical protein